MLLKKKLEIEEWLNKNHVHSYELIEDDEYGYVVNVNSFVKLNHKKLKSIDVKFNIVKGWFDCSYNELTSLEGCPEILESYLWCNDNKLSKKSLKYLPKEIKNNYLELLRNPKLDELQNITNFNELKQILTINKEKAELMRGIRVSDKTVKSSNSSVVVTEKIIKI